MAANTFAGMVIPTITARTTVCRQQRNTQKPAFGSSFIKGNGPQFAGQNLRIDSSIMAGSRKVTAMAAKGAI